MKHVIEGKVLQNSILADKIYDLRLQVPDLFNGQAEVPAPGQFMMLYVEKDAHLLPRPISVCETQPNEGWLRLVYQVVGSGTAHFAALPEGATLRMMGPLGHGFAPVDTNVHLLVGGGVGVPPLLLLAKRLRENADTKNRVVAVLGFRDEPFLISDFKSFCDDVQVTTDSGRFGYHGQVTGLLRDKKINAGQVYTCGPRPMLKAVVEWAGISGIPVQVSMEERMACGMGACVGCAVAIREGGGIVYKRACEDGPVFDGRQVVL